MRESVKREMVEEKKGMRERDWKKRVDKRELKREKNVMSDK